MVLKSKGKHKENENVSCVNSSETMALVQSDKKNCKYTEWVFTAYTW